ncbi:hypothetical protein CKO50_15785 [Pseudoalteromonas sp. HM-SA03]|uniref:hypothetical protein n=1 Tax=Pseudoalteromonas sp. HM-SA03 TaxID=2029678 RepID=UPI000BAE50E2|nr:hypothetical protein [Pseudoalteromonas sp. HM-SA03]PAY00395.1 hypothetical protein CKO50_15785 [Pseudoalteromonas sp. HM-SA03]
MNVNFLIHSPTQPAKSQNELEPKAEETAELKPLRLSEKDMSKLSGEEVREEQEKAALPPHIQKMVEKLEELKEKIKEEQKLLEELKASDAYSDEMKAELVTQKLEYILGMQTQVIELTKNIQEALKEAGITDPGILLKALA